MSFYIILSSNACQSTQPLNKSNEFIVDWDSPIVLDGNWEVALTYLTYKFEPMKKEYIIEYDKGLIGKHTLVLERLESNNFQSKHNKEIINMTSNEKNIIQFENKKVPFSIKFDTLSHANAYGLTEIEADSEEKNGSNIITFDNPANEIKPSLTEIYVEYKGKIVTHYETITDISSFQKGDDLITYFKKYFDMVFNDIWIDCNGYIVFTICDDIDYFKFLPEELFYFLGFNGKIYFWYWYGKQYKAVKKLQVINNIEKVYICSSIVEKTLVGDRRIPVINNCIFENKLLNEIHFKNPKYLPVTQHSINNIKTEIRDVNGELINIPVNSVTHCTLHFRRNE